jgi:hypothetical protein
LNERAFISLFPIEEISAILNAVLVQAETLHKKTDTDREDDLSDRLHKRLCGDVYIRNAPFSVYREVRIYNDDIEEAGHTGRIDFCCTMPPGNDTYFAIEAKRLHVTFPNGKWKSLVSEYVTGDQGMMCFVTGKYAAHQETGAMLGYVFDGDVHKARRSISDSIDANQNALKISQKLAESSIVKRVERVYETRHALDRRIFTMYHLLVSVQGTMVGKTIK